MNKFLYRLSVLFIWGQVCFAASPAPFGIFKEQAISQTKQEIAPFGLFDTPEVRSRKHAEYVQGTSPEQLEFKEQQASQAALLEQILQLRETKRALRQEYLAQIAPSTNQVSYKLRNRRLKQVEHLANALSDLQANQTGQYEQDLSQRERPELDLVDLQAFALNACMPKDFAYKRKTTQDKQISARCASIKELAFKYVEVVLKLIELEQEMVVSLARDLTLLRKLAVPELGNHMAQLDYPLASKHLTPLSIQ